jgi:hypothetical protein
MKKIIYLAAICLLISGCTDFLNTRNLFEKNTENFYRTPTDVNEALRGVYASLYSDAEQLVSTVLEDLTLGGGGADDAAIHNIAAFTYHPHNIYQELWSETYRGVHRANTLIEALQSISYDEFFATDEEAEAFRNNTLGEAYFIRGLLMFRAARFFGEMPLIISTEMPRNVPRSSITDTFGQIADDFDKAASLMPEIDVNSLSINLFGHTNKWVAKAYVARTFLHYTGYMTNIEKTPTTELTLPDGSKINKAQVITYLEDVMNKSGHSLLDDFRSLWPYSYVNTSAGANVLPWAASEDLSWAGQDGPRSNTTFGTGNTEVMFSLRYALAEWGFRQRYQNGAVLGFSIRGNLNLIPYGPGWGFAPVHPVFYSEWDNADARKRGSVLDIYSPDEGIADDYNPAVNNGYHQTGLSIKKYIALQHEVLSPTPTNPNNIVTVGMFFDMYKAGGGSNSYMLWNAQDFYYLRYADILLMHAELTETVDGINAVRQRTGLPPVAGYSLQALKDERKYEFAFEGIRWFDLVRWGDVENSANNYYSREANVLNNNVAARYSVTYRPETKGLVAIPESEIRLSNGIYKQNPGW